MAVKISVVVTWIVTPCSFVEGMYRLHLQGSYRRLIRVYKTTRRHNSQGYNRQFSYGLHLFIILQRGKHPQRYQEGYLYCILRASVLHLKSTCSVFEGYMHCIWRVIVLHLRGICIVFEGCLYSSIVVKAMKFNSINYSVCYYLLMSKSRSVPSL